MQTGEAAKPKAPQLDLDELMERIRAEVAERNRASGVSAGSKKSPAAAADFASRTFTAQALLALPAAEFARAVHLAFLGREPTPEEFVRERDRVLTGQAGRMRILREFRVSRAHRESGRRLDGFWRASVWDRVYWSPPAKTGRSLAGAIGGIFAAPRRIREYITTIEILERRAAEAAATIRALQATQTADRQNAARQLRQANEQISSLRQALNSRAGALESRTAAQSREAAALAAQCRDMQTTLVDHWRTILDQKLRTESFLSAGAPEAAGAEQRGAGRAAEQSHLLDPLYLSFEDRYRGTREEIKERQRVYLPRIQACFAQTGDGPVIDIGCGRGEWLELLGENNIAARGYDLNRIAVEESRSRGLAVELRDAVEILGALPESSCAAITAFHVIEHIGFEALVELLDRSLRVLRPGGILILETPNPANIVVAAETFYFDPTHRNPLPSQLTGYLLKSRGFCDVEILPLHPVERTARKNYDDPMLALLQDKLFGPQDYGAIGCKPS